jgi:hypothetical protein
MKRIAKTCTAAAAAALLLAACNSADGSSSSDDSSEAAGGDPVYTEMASWNACEVLDNLQPITEEMGIVGWGSSTAEGGEPGNSEIGNTFDPEAIGCNGLINLGQNDWTTGEGEIQVKIVPTEGDEQAATAFEDRLAAAESEAASNEDAATSEFADPWDQGALVSWTGNGGAPNVEVVARDGQWVFHIQLNHNQDYGLENTGEPAFAFTDEELNQWFVETYLPQVNQTVNDRIAEVQ